jgi:lauroyl/myristoyl acyltransferase
MSQNTFDRWHWFFLRIMLEIQYRYVFPVLALLPASVGMFCVKYFGLFCAFFDFDWRTVGLERHFVADNSRKAFAEINPKLDPIELDRLVRERFVYAAYEELEGHWLGLGRGAEFHCSYEGLEAVMDELTQRKSGIVFLTFHFDAAIMGIAQIGRIGLTLNPMSTRIVEHPKLPASVRNFFRKKYAGLNSFLNGGRVMHTENHLKDFYIQLRRGENVIILGDAFTEKLEAAIIVNFLGKQRAIAPGAFRLAEKTHASLVAFVCLRTAVGSYRIIFSPVYSPRDGSHETNTTKLFTFLEDHIRRYPERWWAADLLPDFITIKN